MSAAWMICLICMLVSPIVVICCGLLRQKGCPMNAKIGYNTELSRSSKEAWDYAQKASGLRYVVFGLILAVLSVFIMLNVPADNAMNAFIFTGTMLLTQVLLIMLLISTVESGLRARYGKKAA